MAKPKKRASRKDFTAVREKLRTERDDLIRQKEELERGHAEAGDAAGEADVADVGTATFARERDLSVMENIRDLLDQVEHALVRIEEGTYGSCESCGKTIEAARLKALPYAALCIDCKRKQGRR
jgi:DnaK suppressor protein